MQQLPPMLLGLVEPVGCGIGEIFLPLLGCRDTKMYGLNQAVVPMSFTGLF
jgi:hypothetical protein